MEPMAMAVEGEGGETSPSPPPPRLVRVKMEMEYPTNSLELQMEELQDDFEEEQEAVEGEDDDGSLDDYPPLLYPEASLEIGEMQNGHHGMSMDDDYRNISVDHQLPPHQDEGNVWYQCKHCSILLDDVMAFLFHLRVHEDSSAPGSGELGMDPPSLQKELIEAGVTIFLPLILTSKISGDENYSLPPLPRLTRAPSISTLTHATNELPVNPLLTEHLPRKCKLCIPHLHFSRRQEFIDHLFQQHRLDKEFRCSKTGCRYKTRSVQFIESHMENHPEPYSRIYTCHLCTPKTKWYQSTRYAQHMRVHLGKDGKYRCLYCDYATTGLQLLNKHTKKKHPETGDGLVDASGSRGPNPYRARPPHPLPTPIQQTRAVKLKRKDGRGQGQEGRQFLCYFCSKTWLSRKQYESHMILRHRNTHGGYSCQQCNFEADSIRLIARHFKYKHGGEGLLKEFKQAERETDATFDNGDMTVDGLEEGDYDLDDDMMPEEEEEPLLDEEDEEEEEDYVPLPPRIPSGVVSKTPLVLSSPSLTLTGGSPTVVKMEVSCPLCWELPPLGSHQKYFDHIFQKHCRDNAVYCPHCQFRATSLETTLQHVTTAHPPALLRSQLTQEQESKPTSPIKPSSSISIPMPTPNYGPGKLNYLCRFCNSTWSEVLAYSAHMKQHLDSNGHYQCPYCHLPYPTLNRFNEHVKRRHEMVQPSHPPPRPSPANRGQGQRAQGVATVQVAASKRPNSIAISHGRRLLGSEHMKKSYACFYCTPQGLNFTSVKLYSRHMRELHMSSDGLYACPSCPTVLPTTLKKINEHMKRKSHNSQTGSEVVEQREGQGPILAQLLTQNQSVDESVVKQEVGSGVNPTIHKWFQCYACFILVESKEKLIIHQRTHVRPQVEQPKPTRFEDETDYVREAEERRSLLFRPNLPLQMPLHKCKICNPPSWHRTLAKLDEHVRESHPAGHVSGESIGSGPGRSPVRTPPAMTRRPSPRGRAKLPPGAPAPTSPTKPGGGRKMTCLFCFTVFTKQRAYIKHMHEEHADEGGCFTCPKCPNYSTPLLSRATKHIRRHTRPEPQPPPSLTVGGGVRKKRRGKLRRVARGANGRKGVPVTITTTTTLGTIQFKTEPS